MNLDQIHTPERLEGESLPEYRSRQRMSRLVAQRTKLLGTPKQPHRASAAKRARRELVAAVGIRQARMALRQARGAARKVVEDQHA